MLDWLRIYWEEAKHPDRLVLWAASNLCFVGFFHLSELLPLSENQLTYTSGGINWGNVMVDDARTPSVLKVDL